MTTIIGLTGSFGSGKSAVAGMFKELGCPVQDADQAARDAVAPGSEGLREVVSVFGQEILNGGGELNRKKVAEIVFSDGDARRKLNAIIHPRVREAQARFLQENGKASVIVFEIPLLLETGGRGAVHRVVVVTASERTRFGRLKRAGFSEKEIIARLGTQMPQARKIQLADHLIDNDGDLEATREQVQELWKRLAESPKGEKVH